MLEQAGLVSRRKGGRVHNLNAQPGPVREARDWCAMFARVWEEQFDALEEFLKGIGTKDFSNPTLLELLDSIVVWTEPKAPSYSPSSWA